MSLADNQLWSVLDTLLATSELVIDRPRGSAHPRFETFICPLDYGYLAGTSAGDGEGIDVWLGSADPKHLNAVLCSADLLKRDAELKLLLGCTAQDAAQILSFMNDHSEAFGAQVLWRPAPTPGVAL